MTKIRYLLVFIPIAIAADLLHAPAWLVLASACLAIVPLAQLVGEGTEVLAARLGPRWGGLLNATFGNAAELIITISAIQAGLLELVKASITGSILGNLLFVLGLSMVAGGWRHGVQRFNRVGAGMNATMMILAVLALLVPSFFGYAIDKVSHPNVEYMSLGVAAAMIVIYGLNLLYAMRTPHADLTNPLTHDATASGPHWDLRTATGVLLASTVAIVVMSEILVGAVEPVVAQYGLSEFFLGIILIPIIGNAAEHLVGVQMALKNNMDLSLEISVGSGLQIALFVAPVLVFVAPLFGRELTLVFNTFELIALIASSFIATFVSLDGESNWLEGAQLLVLYIILALAFFFLPTTASAIGIG
jgi:Ca2+:H+ antiporter